MGDELARHSTFLSYVLRHRPDAIGLVLDAEGWAEVPKLIEGARASGRSLDAALIRAIVETSDKQRFALSPDGSRIRAVQGHSTPMVERTFVALSPPATLFHGTALANMASILDGGLQPRGRHHVHLSRSRETAMIVGARHGAPVLLAVDSGAMHAAGHAFFQAENGVWLTAGVPARFLRRIEG